MISQIVVYLALALAGAWTLRNPIVGLAAYYVLALARPQDVYWWWGETHLSFAIAALLTAVWLVGWIQHWHRGPGTSPINTLSLSLLLLKAMSAVFATDQIAAWGHMETVAKMALFYYVTVSLVDTRARFRCMILVTAASLAYLGLWGNWHWYVNGVGGGATGELAGPGWEDGRALGDRNLFGYMLVVGIPFCFFVFFAEASRSVRCLALGCIPFLANAVMLTFSRASFLAMVAGFSWSVLRLRRTLPMIGFGFLGAIMMFRLVGPAVTARLMTIQEYEQDTSAANRLESWKAGFAMMGDHPLFGVGLGNYKRYSSAYNSKVPEGLLAHNTFIETTAETGIPAGLVLLAILASAFSTLHRVRKAMWPTTDTRWAYYSAAMLESSWVCYIVAAMFVSLPYFELFYLLLGLTVALGEIARRMPEEPVSLDADQRLRKASRVLLRAAAPSIDIRPNFRACRISVVKPTTDVDRGKRTSERFSDGIDPGCRDRPPAPRPPRLRSGGALAPGSEDTG